MTPTSPAAEWRSAALMLVGPCVILMSIAIARGPFDLGRRRPTPSWLLRALTEPSLLAGIPRKLAILLWITTAALVFNLNQYWFLAVGVDQLTLQRYAT